MTVSLLSTDDIGAAVGVVATPAAGAVFVIAAKTRSVFRSVTAYVFGPVIRACKNTNSDTFVF
jgi:hypothetical protein